MILNSITLKNFGLYKGENTIELSPLESNRRHITIISGQNGVGKSTLQEAIHLCLLGPLAVDDRLSESNYDSYLIEKVHKQIQNLQSETSIELCFAFAKAGRSNNYKVVRKWQKFGISSEEIFIWENNIELNDLTKKEKNLFLRELIQPGFSRIMFFDGEKLSSLYEEENLSHFVAEACKSLFGLNFVEILKSDLVYFTNKLLSLQQSSTNSAELKKIESTLSELKKEYNILKDAKTDLQLNNASLNDLIVEKEDEISKQGRSVTKKLDKIKLEKDSIESAIRSLKKNLVEIYSSLGAFAFCKDLSLSLKDQIIKEDQIEKFVHAQDLIDRKATEIEAYLTDKKTAKLFSIDLKQSKKLAESIKEILLESSNSSSINSKIYHQISESQRTKLIGWIDLVFDTVHGNIKKYSDEILKYEERQKFLSKELLSFSSDSILQPLLRDLQELNKQLGANESKIDSIVKKITETTDKLDFYNSKIISLKDKLFQSGSVDERLLLSSKTKDLLEDYGRKVLSKKIELLERKVLSHFNLLCRKQNYFDRLTIDSANFHIKLFKNDQSFNHKTLSAGEKQILVISFLWGLRELTNISLPLIIDTPMARLDRQHRSSFINQFLPAIQPQVIVIGTDMELLSNQFSELEPYVNRHYSFSFDENTRSTKIELLPIEIEAS